MFSGKLTNPVFIIRGNNMRPLIAQKIIFPDGAQVVVARTLDLLWAGDDGQSWGMHQPGYWQLMGATQNGIITLRSA